MKMRKFKQDKLWRNKLVDLKEQMGSKIHYTRLNNEEFTAQLKVKLIEEANEVCTAQNKQELIEELGDVMEVISSICQVHEFTMQDIVDAQIKKSNALGGFSERKYVTIAEHPEDSAGAKYCLAQPAKYPEIVD